MKQMDIPPGMYITDDLFGFHGVDRVCGTSTDGDNIEVVIKTLDLVRGFKMQCFNK